MKQIYLQNKNGRRYKIFLKEFIKKYNKNTNTETPENYKNELNSLHVQYFKKDLEYLTEHIKHYKKLKERWKKVGITFKYINGFCTLVGSVGAIVIVSISSLGTLTIPLTAGFAGLGVFTNIPDNCFNIFNNNKVKKYKDYLKILEKTNDEFI